MTNSFYPKPGRYFAQLTKDRPIFQGDIFRGGFGAWWRHPVALKAILAGEAVPDDPVYPALGELTANVLVRGQGYAMILPQPCEYSEGEKGATHPYRLVAPLFPLDRHAGVDHSLVRSGTLGHTLWVPNWKPGSPADYFVDLRLITSIDSTFIRREVRAAALSRVAWLSLADRLSRYFVGTPLDLGAFSLVQGHLHPDFVDVNVG